MKAPSEEPAEWMKMIHIDKIAHIIAYAALAFLLMRDKLSVLIVLIFCFFYGLGIELLQGRYFESRHFEIFDLFANISGSILGIVFYNLLKRTE